MLGLNPKPAWAEEWHLWKLIIPRRSIACELVRGQVWRRHDGLRWIYKAFTEFDLSSDAGRVEDRVPSP